MEMKKIVEAILECGERDVEVISDIDSSIVVEAIERIKEEGIELDFPALYHESAKIGIEKVGINEEEATIDANYACAAIYLKSKQEKKAKELKKLGFVVYY